MRGRRGLDLLVVAAVAVAGAGVPRAASAAEADPGEPSVCAPPCADGETCTGGRCLAPRRRARPQAAEAPPQPKPPASATYLGVPQAAPGRAAAAPTPPAPAPAPAAPTPGQAYPPPPQPDRYPPPPPGYYYPPPPPGRAPPPPPGYYYYPPPQPGRAPPPPGAYQYPYAYPYAPPPPGTYYPAPPPPAYRKRRFLTLPYLGIHSYQNQEASAYDPGARFGVLLGGRIGDVASLNGELSINRSNVHGQPSTSRFEETNVVFAFSPLFQLPAGPVELALGPKLGIFVIETSLSDPTVALDQNMEGYVLGANLGLFFPVSPRTSLGVLLSYDLLFADRACQTITNAGETCSSVSDSNSFRMLGLTAAALF
ncbi:MAG TPA: hypothetical protein VIF57_21770 [Polyangia bacterium]